MPDQNAGWLSPFLQERRIRAAAPFLSGRVLDFGCGNGALARRCAPADYLGVDRDRDSLLVARQRFPRHTFAGEIPADERFDTIVALAVIEHLGDPGALLERFARHLAPGGRIVLTTPHPSVDGLHTAGAAIGLFSREAAEEHDQLIDERAMREIAAKAGLRCVLARRFLLRANQLFVLSR